MVVWCVHRLLTLFSFSVQEHTCLRLDRRLDLSFVHVASPWVVSSKNSVHVARGRSTIALALPGVKRK